MMLHDIFEGDCAFFTVANALQYPLRRIHVLKIFEVLQDGFTDIVRLRAPGAPGKLFKTFFDGQWKSNSKHNRLAIQV